MRAFWLLLCAVFAFSVLQPSTSCIPCGGAGTCCPPEGTCLGGSCTCLDEEGWAIQCETFEVVATSSSAAATAEASTEQDASHQETNGRLLQQDASVPNLRIHPNTAAAAAVSDIKMASSPIADPARHGNRKLQQFAGLGNLAVGAATSISDGALNIGGVALQLANFYGLEGLGIRSRLGMLPAPGGLPLLLLGGPHALPGPEGMTLGYIGGTLEYAAEMTHPITALAAVAAAKEVAASEGAGNLMGADGFSGLGLASGTAAVFAQTGQQAVQVMGGAMQQAQQGIQQHKQQASADMLQKHVEKQQKHTMKQQALVNSIRGMLKGAGSLLNKLGGAPGSMTGQQGAIQAQGQVASSATSATAAYAVENGPGHSSTYMPAEERQQVGFAVSEGYDPSGPVAVTPGYTGYSQAGMPNAQAFQEQSASYANGYSSFDTEYDNSSMYGADGGEMVDLPSAASLGLVSDYQ